MTPKNKYIITFSETSKSLIVPTIIVVIIWEILSEIIKWQWVKKYIVNWIQASQIKALRISPINIEHTKIHIH